MVHAFIIVLREGLEAFLPVAILFSYLRKYHLTHLLRPLYWGTVVALFASVRLGIVLASGVEEATITANFGVTFGGFVNLLLGNEGLRVGLLGLVAIVAVSIMVIQFWRPGPTKLEKGSNESKARSSRIWRFMSVVGVFLFALLLITRTGMEVALMFVQVQDSQIMTGGLVGLTLSALLALLWARLGSLIQERRFFQVTGLFLSLFILQLAIYSFHEFAEAGVLPASEAIHEVTEKFSADGIYGKWFSLALLEACTLWLQIEWLFSRLRSRQTPYIGSGLELWFLIGSATTLLLPWLVFYQFVPYSGGKSDSFEIVILLLYLCSLSVGIGGAQLFLRKTLREDLERTKERNKAFFERLNQDISHLLRTVGK